MEKELEIKMENIEDFKKFASTITRKSFKEDYLVTKNNKNLDIEICFYINDEYINCPSKLHMQNEESENICLERSNCRDCWLEVIKGIYFKDDIDRCSLVKEKDSITYDYTKEYTLLEIFEFPKDTLFISDNCKIKVDRDILFLYDSEENLWDQCYVTKKWLMGKFKLVRQEKEVTFAEVLNSNSECKIIVKHFLINAMESKELNKYMTFDDYLYTLCTSEELDCSDIKEIIKTGKWFIKDGE